MALHHRFRVTFVQFLLLVVVGFLSGCTHTIPLKGVMDRPVTIAQLPISVGVFYAPEFKAYEHMGSRSGDRWAFQLGSASMKLYDQAFPILFSKVVPVQSRPPLPLGSPECAAIIEPRIESFDFGLPMLKTGTYSAEITYRFILYSPKGDPVASWTIKGQGARSGQAGFEFARWPGEAADLAMQDAVDKFLTTFTEVPEVRVWLRQNNYLASAQQPLVLNKF